MIRVVGGGGIHFVAICEWELSQVVNDLCFKRLVKRVYESETLTVLKYTFRKLIFNGALALMLIDGPSKSRSAVFWSPGCYGKSSIFGARERKSIQVALEFPAIWGCHIARKSSERPKINQNHFSSINLGFRPAKELPPPKKKKKKRSGLPCG